MADAHEHEKEGDMKWSPKHCKTFAFSKNYGKRLEDFSYDSEL